MFCQKINIQSLPMSINILGRIQRPSSKDKSSCSTQSIAHTYYKTLVFPPGERSSLVLSGSGRHHHPAPPGLWESLGVRCSESLNSFLRSCREMPGRPRGSAFARHSTSPLSDAFPSRITHFSRRTFIFWFCHSFYCFKIWFHFLQLSGLYTDVSRLNRLPALGLMISERMMY